MKKLRDILYGVSIQELVGTTDCLVPAIHFDSREVTKNACFIALKGSAMDGHKYISPAIKDGARIIICETLPQELVEEVNYVVVSNAHYALAIMAHNFFNQPSKKLKLVGITGTNGKTTSTTLLYQLFRKIGYSVGLISTVVNKIDDQEFPTKHTTPNPLVLNELLEQMVENGCEYCFMEVSSHAIHQHRISGLEFYIAGFTNITHEHLDYHNTFREYLEVKKSFFDNLSSNAHAITNVDDKNGLVMLQNCKAKHHTYALKNMADFRAKVIENNFSGLVLQLEGTELYTKLIGDFNAYNLLLVYGIARLLNNNSIEILRVISELESVEGRFEYFKSESGVIVIVDYAHTPDALENVLKTIKNIRTNNETVYTIVGCGGDRDPSKRPVMAKIACDLSDKAILTSDNPRTENPDQIISEMMEGVDGANYKKTLCITNRMEAIKAACSQAEKNDIILIAGKGHETYQEINGVRHDFDDLEIAKEILIKLQK